MAWPITAATATILAASMALIFVPVLGSLFGKRAAESGDLNSIGRFAGSYIRLPSGRSR